MTDELRSHLHERQRGAVLIVALIFLMLITLLALSASWAGQAQEKLAGGQRQSAIALEGAETAVRQAERWIYTFYERSQGEALVGMWGSPVLPANPGESDAALGAFMEGNRWIDGVGTAVPASEVPFANADPTTRLWQSPRYVIEDLGPLRPRKSPSVTEGQSTSGVGDSVGGMTPAGNAEIRLFRITGKSAALNNAPVRTVQTTFAGRAKT